MYVPRTFHLSTNGQLFLVYTGNKTATLVDLDASVKYNVSVQAVTKFDSSSPVEGAFTTRNLKILFCCTRVQMVVILHVIVVGLLSS